MDDPGAPGGTWDHWIVYDIPGEAASLPQESGAPGNANLPPGARHGTNSWGHSCYQGPAPPRGTGVHRYFFKLCALDAARLAPRAGTQPAIQEAMEGHILGTAEWRGTYIHAE